MDELSRRQWLAGYATGRLEEFQDAQARGNQRDAPEYQDNVLPLRPRTTDENEAP